VGSFGGSEVDDVLRHPPRTTRSTAVDRILPPEREERIFAWASEGKRKDRRTMPRF